jgi:polyhydroxyalkanoate synthesis regulator phasin
MCNETLSEEARQQKARAIAFFREAWSLALLKAGAAEEEAGRVLVRAAEVAGWGEGEARRLAKDLGERLATQRSELERSLEERIGSAIGQLKLPKREELQGLSERLERLEARLSKLQADKPRGSQ